MDRIRWINHAGFELQTGGLRIVCDPWLVAFNQSWALISKTRYSVDDFAGVDFLWLSHEHPDHFSPANLRSIPATIRSSITVLFRKARDGRVAKFCRDLGFKTVMELRDWERLDLGHGVFFSLKSVDEDSLCFIETPQTTYLNINDCVAPDATALHQGIHRKTGSPGILLTQFSFANWAGNPGDAMAMKKLAEEKVQQIERQIDIYRPKTLIPFASYVWLCRTDNFHLNSGANKIEAIHRHFSPRVDCVILYPGDIYETGTEHSSAAAVERYAADEESHSAPLSIADEMFSPERLDGLSVAHHRKMRAQNGMWAFWPLRLAGFIKPVRIYLSDIDRSLVYSMFSGIRWEVFAREEADIEFASYAMAQMLRHGSGYDTLYISGRFTERRAGSRFDLSKNFVVLRRNEHGQFFPGAFFDKDYVLGRLGIDGSAQ